MIVTWKNYSLLSEPHHVVLPKPFLLHISVGSTTKCVLLTPMCSGEGLGESHDGDNHSTTSDAFADNKKKTWHAFSDASLIY